MTREQLEGVEGMQRGVVLECARDGLGLCFSKCEPDVMGSMGTCI
jgi:hypothetical protein